MKTNDLASLSTMTYARLLPCMAYHDGGRGLTVVHNLRGWSLEAHTMQTCFRVHCQPEGHDS